MRISEKTYDVMLKHDEVRVLCFCDRRDKGSLSACAAYLSLAINATLALLLLL